MIEFFPNPENAKRFFEADGFRVGKLTCSICKFEGYHVEEDLEKTKCPLCNSIEVNFEEEK